MIRKMLVVLICLALLSLVNNSFASSGIGQNKQIIYENGKSYFVLNKYEEALQQFQQISDYRDSISWKYYCEGMISIEMANEKESGGCLSETKKLIENAYQRFRILSANQFEESEKLEIYCTARLYELKGLYQSALDLYATLIGIADSDERYFRIINGIPLPTQAPNYDSTVPFLPLIPAHVNKTTETFMGPGSNYQSQKLVSLTTGTSCSIVAREGYYYLVELTTEYGKIRCWTYTLRIERDENKQEPEIGKNKRNGYMLESKKGLYGPSVDYVESETIIPAGTKIIIYESEGLYTMVEFQPIGENALMRLWVPTESISK